jgi:hypothetical protein
VDLQLHSSSRTLALERPTGKRIISRGNPFGNSVGDCAGVLHGRGIARA